MKISEQQLQKLLIIARDSLRYEKGEDRFAYPVETRRDLVGDIINQQDATVIDIEGTVTHRKDGGAVPLTGDEKP